MNPPSPHSHAALANRRHGLLLASLGAIAFSGKAIIVKLAYRYGVDAVTLIMYRMLFALPMFLVLTWWAGRGKPPLTWRDARAVLGLGFCGYYLASFLDFAGLRYISAGLERLILYLNPTLVLGLGVLLFQRKASRQQIVALGVSYAGVLCVFGREVSLQGANVPLGASLVFGSAVSYAVYLAYSGEEVKRLGALRLTGLATTVACFICIAQFVILRPLSAMVVAPRSALAFGIERHRLHLRARSHGDDGHRADRRFADRANRQLGTAIHHPPGDAAAGRTVHGVGGGGHRAGSCRNLAARETESAEDSDLTGAPA